MAKQSQSISQFQTHLAQMRQEFQQFRAGINLVLEDKKDSERLSAIEKTLQLNVSIIESEVLPQVKEAAQAA